MRARDQSSIFSTGVKFRPDYGLLLELHTLILVARSYALLRVGRLSDAVTHRCYNDGCWYTSTTFMLLTVQVHTNI